MYIPTLKEFLHYRLYSTCRIFLHFFFVLIFCRFSRRVFSIGASADVVRNCKNRPFLQQRKFSERVWIWNYTNSSGGLFIFVCLL